MPLPAVSIVVTATLLGVWPGPRLPCAGGQASPSPALVALGRAWPERSQAQAPGTASSPRREEAAEGATVTPVAGFLKGVKAVIPWVAGLFLIGGLALVVLTCWLRKGVLVQDLSSGGGSTGAGKPQVDQRAAAEYLARVRQRHAERRAREEGPGGRSQGP